MVEGSSCLMGSACPWHNRAKMCNQQSRCASRRLLDTLLSGLLRGKCLASFVSCVKKRMCAVAVRVSDGNVRRLFVNLWFLKPTYSTNLDDLDGNVILLSV